jgi:hypothetical protein
MLEDNIKAVIGYESFKGSNDISVLKLSIHVQRLRSRLGCECSHMDELNKRGLSNSHCHGDSHAALSWRGPFVAGLAVLDSAFLVPVEASKAPSREPALFLLEALVLGVSQVSRTRQHAL